MLKLDCVQAAAAAMLVEFIHAKAQGCMVQAAQQVEKLEVHGKFVLMATAFVNSLESLSSFVSVDRSGYDEDPHRF